MGYGSLEYGITVLFRLGITPFNFPAMIPLWMFPLALVTGNTMVLKPSEQDPGAAMMLVELAKVRYAQGTVAWSLICFSSCIHMEVLITSLGRAEAKLNVVKMENDDILYRRRAFPMDALT